MTEPTRDDIDVELLQRLRAAAPIIRYPPTPDIASTVCASIVGAPAPRSTPRRRPPVFVTMATATAILVALGLLLVPASRETIAGWFAVPGIRIEFRDDDVEPTAVAGPDVPLGLLFGQPVSLEEARSLVEFPIAVPEYPGLGPPDEVYVRTRPEGDQVIFLYAARPGFPATAETGIGLMLLQFEAPEDAFWGVKVVNGSNDIRVVRIDGEEGVWIGGSHQLLIVPDPDPLPAIDPMSDATSLAGRPSANVLLWDNGFVTLRIEADLPRQTAIAVAESLVLPPLATPKP